MTMNWPATVLCSALTFLAACSSAPLPQEPPPLADMEQPLDLMREPDDEAKRAALPQGSFSGLVVEDARQTLAQKLEGDAQLRVTQVVENSPGMAAGVQVDDLLLEARVGSSASVVLQRMSEWRKLELDTPAGTAVELLLDRGGRDAKTTLTLAPRVRSAQRTATETFREEDRVGVVVRTATEVEARGAGLGPGGGAVITGLSQRSPWRAAGLRFSDVIVSVDGKQVAHPQDLVLALRDRSKQSVALEFVRDGQRSAVQAPLSERDGEVTDVSIPLLWSYEHKRGVTDWSAVLGIVSGRSTKAAWEFRLFWLLRFGGGDSDQLVEGGK